MRRRTSKRRDRFSNEPPQDHAAGQLSSSEATRPFGAAMVEIIIAFGDPSYIHRKCVPMFREVPPS
jgi:hypothetical protein